MPSVALGQCIRANEQYEAQERRQLSRTFKELAQATTWCNIYKKICEMYIKYTCRHKEYVNDFAEVDINTDRTSEARRIYK